MALRAAPFYLLILLLLSGALQAQTQQDSLRLKKRAVAEQPWRSAVQKIDSPYTWGFLGLSAYCEAGHGPETLYIRFREADRWESWKPMPGPDHGKARGRQSWIAKPRREAAQAFQIGSPRALKGPLILRTFKAPPPEKKSASTTARPQTGADSCACPAPPICQRSCWCPGGNCPPPSYSSHNPTHLVVHHSAGFTDYPDYQWVVSYYWDLHVNTNGWSDIGYNWLIDPNGVVYEGRGLGHLGAHFSCMNSGTSGICLIGNFMDTVPSDTALNRLSALATYLACQHRIFLADSSLHSSSQLVLPHLSGHRAANVAQQGCPSGTVCPGDSLFPLLDSLAWKMASQACLQGLGRPEAEPGRLRLYPQPAQHQVKLRWPQAAPRVLKLHAPSGQVVKTIKTAAARHTISLEGVPSGLYLLEVNGPRGLYWRRLMIRKED
ncbi:MAG: N-acetylmuramoyl-L-alanine amidase [Schleiferiaceae bacterium]|nr:N-acetylmuramoyl-L-alanine amidase [Schleiferiaceae bacterium]